jgi:hypothetical protein
MFRAILVIGLALSIPMAAQKTQRPKLASPSQRVKIAEGKYQMKGAAGGFEEPWTIFKTRLGYEVTEQWIVPTQVSEPPQVIDVSVQMVNALRPVQVHIGDSQMGLSCSIAMGVFKCETQGKQSQMALSGPYDFFSPSPWMLGNIVRRATKDKSQKATIKLARIDGASEQGVNMSSFTASVQYVGDDQVELSGEKRPASIYELRADGAIPAMLVWVADDGIVFAIQDSSRPDQRLELSNLQRYGKF